MPQRPRTVLKMAVVLGMALQCGCEIGAQIVLGLDDVAAAPGAPSQPMAATAFPTVEQLDAAVRRELAQAAPPPPEVGWMEPGADLFTLGVDHEPDPNPLARPASPDPRAAEPPSAELSNRVQVWPATPAAVTEPASRQVLLDRLRQQIQESPDPPLSKTLQNAVLDLVGAASRTDPMVGSDLDPDQRKLVKRYYQALIALNRQAAEGAGPLDRQDIEARLDEVFGTSPLEIVATALCRRVDGYGIFEESDRVGQADSPDGGSRAYRFLAGRVNKTIVYAELDHFRSVREDTGEFQVKLKQALVLYNEADGLAVWRNDPVEIRDLSRNQRRDFFIVQLVSLPARLNVGKYRLKVRVTDRQGSSIDETTLPIEIVADPALVRAERPWTK